MNSATRTQAPVSATHDDMNGLNLFCGNCQLPGQLIGNSYPGMHLFFSRLIVNWHLLTTHHHWQRMFCVYRQVEYCAKDCSVILYDENETLLTWTKYCKQVYIPVWADERRWVNIIILKLFASFYTFEIYILHLHYTGEKTKSSSVTYLSTRLEVKAGTLLHCLSVDLTCRENCDPWSWLYVVYNLALVKWLS